MGYIKKLVINGFKSFATKTEIPFDQDINVIIGPNGSGKSNVSDALCFVLGRLGSKSLRAAKSSNMIFQGTKGKKPGKEAYVELVFDNSDKMFNIDSKEIHIKRIVRKKGTSIYKINNETKTRLEVIELLSQAGIDPNGFNIVLQGEIARLIKMRGDDRRAIIEEVAGISIYESRKHKSLHEIEKTEQKLKEVGAVLRERTSYLRNLEQERKQALRFKELEKSIKQCKATIIKRSLDEKTREIEVVEKNISKNVEYKDKIKTEIGKINQEINKVEERINEINKHIHKATGLEREDLNDEITELNTKIAADSARKENFEKRLADNEIRKQELKGDLNESQKQLEELKKKSPAVSKRQDDLKKKKQELAEVEKEKSKLYSVQTEFNSLKDRIRDKQKLFHSSIAESKLIFNQIKHLSDEVSFQTVEECENKINHLNSGIKKLENEIKVISSKKSNIDNSISLLEAGIQRFEKLKLKMPDKGQCPLCQTKLTKEHISHVLEISDKRVKRNKEQINELANKRSRLEAKYSDLGKNLGTIKQNLSNFQLELIKLNNIKEKKIQMKKIMENEKLMKNELQELEKKKDYIEGKVQQIHNVEERYDKLFFEMQEISSRTDENLDTTILYKEREIENFEKVIKNIIKDKKEIEKEIGHLSGYLVENREKLDKKQKDSEILNTKFKNLYSERTDLQEKIKQKNTLLVNKQNALGRIEDVINEFKIEKARHSASKESFEFELKDFQGVGFISGSMQFLKQKLEKSQRIIVTIGSVNLRALETYDNVKEEYDRVAEKAEHIENERDEILKVIEEIDKKKKKTFMKTFNAINDLFSRNFSQLSVKGRAFLEIENKEDIFEGGIGITIKVGKGKYFDVSSLSGGEQTLVALALIFAIQEYNPYCFYILDEIDAALDKRNSELLANLLKKYMKAGQYIVISHNDTIISGANVIYGVSMNSGISKVISLRVEGE